MTKILHITPHLGGGVGKILNSLVTQSTTNVHNIICLEVPIKKEIINHFNNKKGNLTINPDIEETINLITDSDIIQIEYWNHPEVIKILKLLTITQIPVRLVSWFHQNGLHDPIPKITEQLILNSVFLFTSECSFTNKNVINLLNEHKYVRETLGFVYSSGGFDDLPYPESKGEVEKTSVGYFGTINNEKKKLHSQFIDYISEVEIPDFKVKMIGECNQNTKNVLRQQCKDNKKSDIVEFTDYIPRREDLISILKSINVNIHLLNPNHYGTAENTLLETCSMGIVPVVLNNLPEKYLVQDGKIGFIADSKKEFADIIKWLYENPNERQRIGLEASKYVREKYSLEKTISYLDKWYKKSMKREKERICINM